MPFDPATLINIGAGLVGLGSVYGLIRGDLKRLYERAIEQSEINKQLFTKCDDLHVRINEHIEHHHLRSKNG